RMAYLPAVKAVPAAVLSVVTSESGWKTPAAYRSRTYPTAALYSGVSRSLMSFPDGSSCQLLGAPNIAAYIGMLNATPCHVPMPQRLSDGRVSACRTRFRSSALVGV